MTDEQKGLLIKMVPERDGHRLELQWSVPPESQAYKIFPCSYLRWVRTPMHLLLSKIINAVHKCYSNSLDLPARVLSLLDVPCSYLRWVDASIHHSVDNHTGYSNSLVIAARVLSIQGTPPAATSGG